MIMMINMKIDYRKTLKVLKDRLKKLRLRNRSTYQNHQILQFVTIQEITMKLISLKKIITREHKPKTFSQTCFRCQVGNRRRCRHGTRGMSKLINNQLFPKNKKNKIPAKNPQHNLSVKKAIIKF
jgi:hypothetical protein